MNYTKRQLDLANILFLTVSPVAALAGGIWYTARFGIHWVEIVLFVAMFFATGLSITGGYHRYFSHLTYKAHPIIRNFYLIFGACAMQNSVLHWATDHRYHHRYTDTDLDPYNAKRGFWWSHMVWIFYKSPSDRSFTMVGDLLRDKWVRWQHRNHVLIAIVAGFGLPTLVGALFGRPLGGFIWGGLIRVVAVHHATFLINSWAHMYGTQPYSRKDTSKDSWWLAFLTNGEGYHNFHHRFPSDYRNGIKWYQWDPTKWLIRSLSWTGLTWKLHRIPPHLILKARMETDALEAEKGLLKLPSEISHPLRARVESARAGFERALAQWAETRRHYRELRQAAFRDSEQKIRQVKARLREYDLRLKAAREHWHEVLEGLHATVAQAAPTAA